MAQRKVLAAEVDLLELPTILRWRYVAVAFGSLSLLDASRKFCLRIVERRAWLRVDWDSLHSCGSIALWVRISHASVRPLRLDVSSLGSATSLGSPDPLLRLLPRATMSLPLPAASRLR